MHQSRDSIGGGGAEYYSSGAADGMAWHGMGLTNLTDIFSISRQEQARNGIGQTKATIWAQSYTISEMTCRLSCGTLVLQTTVVVGIMSSNGFSHYTSPAHRKLAC